MKLNKSCLKLNLKRHHMNSKTLLKPILFSYILILLLPVMLNILALSTSRRLVVDELVNNNNVIISQLANLIDEQLIVSRSSISYISSNKQIMDIISNATKYDREDVANFIKVSDELRSCLSSFNSIDGIYLYFKDIDMVISTSSPMKKNIAYDVFHKNDEYTEETWRRQMDGLSSQQIISVPRSEGNSSIFFLSPLISDGNSGKAVTVAVMLNQNNISKITDYISNNYGNNAVISAFYNNKIFYSNNDDFSGNSIVLSEFDIKNKIFYKNINSEPYIIISKYSSIGQQIRYSAFVPYEEILGRTMRRIMVYIILSIILIFLIDGLIIVYFTRKTYSPIKELADNVGKKTGSYLKKADNEISYIQRTVDSMNVRMHYLDNTLKEKNDLLKNHILVNLLYGRVYTDDVSIREKLSQYGINTESSDNVVVFININSFERLFYGESESQKSNCMFFIFKNVFTDLFDGKFGFEVVKLNSYQYSLIIRLDSDMENLDEILEYAQNFIEENLYVSYIYTISSVYSFDNIFEAFYDAMSQVDGRKTDKNDMLSDFMLDENTESVLINYIRTGEYDSAIQIVTNFWRSFSTDSSELAVYAKYSMLSSLLKALSAQKQIAFFESFKPLKKLEKCNIVDDTIKVFVQLLNDISELASDDTSTKSDDLCSCIMEFIDKNYFDPNLSVAMIGDYFKLTPHYLSGIFKQNVGENLKSYINRFRINKSKTSLCNSYMSILDIAVSNGFFDSNTYIRVFKQYTGITPGKYRDTAIR